MSLGQVRVAVHSNETTSGRIVTPEDLVDGLPAHRAAVVHRLREVVTAAAPEAVERVYPVWNGIGYRHPDAGYFCGIFPFATHVGLAFEFGALLPDPHRLLRPGRTSGKKVRYLEFRTLAEVKPRVIRHFVKESIALKARRSVDAIPAATSKRRRRGAR